MKHKVMNRLRNSGRPLVLAHESPDGDALGAVLGLIHLLKNLGIEALGYRQGLLPAEYRFLPGMDELLTELPPELDPDLLVLLDCHEPKRAGKEAEAYLSASDLPAVVIDHHRGEVGYGQTAWVDPAYAATCEMLTEMALAGGLEISPQAAACLYVGILTDTGSFAHANTSPGVLRSAAALVEAGAVPWRIHGEVYATRPVRQFLFCRILKEARHLNNGRVVMAGVSLADLAEFEAQPYDLENVVEGLRGIPGVQAAALIKERTDGGVKVSLRSRGDIDVARVAMSLGGGGHKNAAGCRLDMGLDEAVAKMAALLDGIVEA